VLVLELLDCGEGLYLGHVKAGAIAYLLGDSACGPVEDCRRFVRGVGLPPAVGLLPRVGDVLRFGCFPPAGSNAELERLAEGRTRITVAHRLSTVRDAHQIVVLDEERIVERGTHDQLTEMARSYAALVARDVRAEVLGEAPAS
jgi:hypothetical protein